MKSFLPHLTLMLVVLAAGALSHRALADEEAPGSAQGADRVAVGQEAPSIVLPAFDEVVHDSTKVEDGKSLVLVFFRGAW